MSLMHVDEQAKKKKKVLFKIYFSAYISLFMIVMEKMWWKNYKKYLQRRI